MNLESVTEEVNLVITHLQTLLSEAKQADERAKQIEILDAELRDKEIRWERKIADFEAQRNTIKSEQLALDVERKQLKGQQNVAELIQHRTQLLEEKKIALDKEQKNLDEKIKQLDKKMQEYSNIEDKIKDIEHRELLIKKEIQADAKRKEALDIREDWIDKETIRLQRIAQQYTH